MLKASILFNTHLILSTYFVTRKMENIVIMKFATSLIYFAALQNDMFDKYCKESKQV